MGFCSMLGESPNTWKHFGPELWTWAAPVSGTGITDGGSGYAALLAHAEGALYGTELGSVTLKRIGFFCFPIKHSTHTESLAKNP
jgi:hypothetical protein